MYSPLTYRNIILVVAFSEDDAKKQAWKWINFHGFKMWVVKAVLVGLWLPHSPREESRKKPLPRSLFVKEVKKMLKTKSA